MHRFIPRHYTTTVGRHRDADDPRGAHVAGWRKTRIGWWQWRDRVWGVHGRDLGSYPTPV